MKKKKFIGIIIFDIVILALAIGTVLFLKKQGKLLPGWIHWNRTSLTLQGDETTYTIEVGGRKIKAYDAQEEVWSLDSKKYKIQDALIMDVNRDGKEDLVVLCWRIGRYDNVPFWKEDPQVWSQHIYVYKTEKGKIMPMWMASDIGPEVDSWYTDGKFLFLHSPDGRENRWIWLDWGFALAN